ncbi:class I SAM-dependent methyltransferase [Larkinella insperata]|uniref:Class I SAM-dependent methyltransferase n=1 Tax=Larkinella insperata TaxID=332158 RepID=A0ABW3QE69_9BACT|nr:class I SAM-dependent methyltransferase [Larkinella insperata]
MAVEHLAECPVCGNQSFSNWLTCKDYLVSETEFTIQSCEKCGFKATNPRPAEGEIGRYYQSEEYISHSDTRKGIISQLYHTVRSITVKQKVNLIKGLSPRKENLLDIGCGSGYFLSASQQAGWKVMGTEPDENARQQAQNRVHVKLGKSIHELNEGQKYHVITLWHVLEHVHELSETLEWMRSHCHANGYVVIAVPNHRSWDAQHYKQFWAAYDVPRHLYHFSPDAMKALLSRYGFEMVEQRPMLFDAFYVNMLSTKNRDGKPAYLESFWNGIRSNWAAYQNGGNYSSLIYIAQAR